MSPGGHLSKILAIILLAILVRFVGLSSLPPVLNRDEAALGYNAFSVLKTGKDEHGVKWPFNFRSLGEYKRPGYIYLTMIPVKLFGLNDFSIRFWSAVAGVISVIIIYLITQKPLIAFLMALNPWAIFYSRIAFEANLALALFLVGLWLIIKKKPWGFIFWLLACLTYSSALIFIPLFLIPLTIKLKIKKIWLVLFIISYSVVFVKLWNGSAQSRQITVFSDPYLIDTYNKERTHQYQINPFKTKLFFNKYIYFGKIVASNYLKTFSPKFLVLKGDNHPWHQIPGVGNFYFIEIILAIIGLFKLKKNRLLFFAWLLLAPLASAITIDAPHSTRSIFLLPIILILASEGLQKVKKFLPIIAVIYFINVAYAGYQYVKIYPQKIALSLPVGLKEQLIGLRNSPEKIYLTGIHDSTYLYPLVYLPVDPKVFQQTAVWTLPDTAGLIHAYKFGNIQIIDDLKDMLNDGVLIKAEP